MSRTARWSVYCVVLVGLGAASALVLHGRQLQLVLILNSPSQLVEIPDERGRLRPARLEANARVYENRVNGGALLEQGNEKYEFRFERLDDLVFDGDVIQRVMLAGRGLKSAGHNEQEFDFEATVTRSPASPDILIYDIKDGFVYMKDPFEAVGTLATAPSR